MDKKDIRTYKIVLIGAAKVGKSSMVCQFVNNYFDAFGEPTGEDTRLFKLN
jgi:GTPase SAR1 family protein